jgi:hypothetical protein
MKGYPEEKNETKKYSLGDTKAVFTCTAGWHLVSFYLNRSGKCYQDIMNNDSVAQEWYLLIM